MKEDGIIHFEDEESKPQTQNRVWSKVETITPQIAQEYLAMNVINRPIHEQKVQEYADMMLRKQWQLNGEAICFDVKGHMVNGQHRLNAVIEAGKSNPNVSIQTIVVRGVEEESFLTFDSGLNRKISDVFSLADVPNYTNISSIVRKVLLWRRLGGTVSARYGGNKRGLSKKDCLDEYVSNELLYQEAHKYASRVTAKIKRIITESDIAALYIWLTVDCRHSVDVVTNFFDSLYSGTNSSVYVINLLRTRLINDMMETRRKMPRLYKWMIIVKTWNAYATNRDLKVLKWDESIEGKIDFV